MESVTLGGLCVYQKIIRVHIFYSNFSRVCMFCDDDPSKLVPVFPELKCIVSLNEITKSEDFTIIEGKVPVQ